mmetsp:Transcript_12904/g.24336  ORF Transcript_12904/g.24336 Transcript_12904/m.24336 type:complete len:369 (+) Transcript_12904:116-1222(+)
MYARGKSFQPGSRVILHALSSHQHFNDQRGTVVRHFSLDHVLGRFLVYEVRLSDGQLVQALNSNLRTVEDDGSEEDSEEDGHESESARKGLCEELFQVLDQTGKGFLRSAELYPLAVSCGFEQGRQQWEGEYQALCKLCGASEMGFGQEQLTSMISMEALPSFCPTADLPDLISTIREHIEKSGNEEAAVPRSKEEKLRMRHEAVQERRMNAELIFNFLDVDGDELLNGLEMERFAILVGFVGDWQVEYEVMCEHNGINPDHGAKLDDFYRLVSDRTSHAYCSRQELRSLVKQIRERRDSITRHQAAILIQSRMRGSLVRKQLQFPQDSQDAMDEEPITIVPLEQEVPEPPPAPPDTDTESDSEDNGT